MYASFGLLLLCLLGGCLARHLRWRRPPFFWLSPDKDAAAAPPPPRPASAAAATTTATKARRRRQPHFFGERHRAGHRNGAGQRPLPKILEAHLRPRAKRTRRENGGSAHGGGTLDLSAFGTERATDITANSPPIPQLRPPRV